VRHAWVLTVASGIKEKDFPRLDATNCQQMGRASFGSQVGLLLIRAPYGEGNDSLVNWYLGKAIHVRGGVFST
jgi:hypothetical protein